MPSLSKLQFHRQNTATFCGPACAQMVLGGLGLDVSALSQTSIFATSNQTDTDSAEWSSYPDGLVKALNARWQNAHGLRFLLFNCATKEDLLRVIRQTIENGSGHNAGPIVATGPNSHWVVLKGIELSTTVVDGEHPMLGFHVHNPLPQRKNEHLAHSDEDDCATDRNEGWPCHYMSLGYWNDDMVHPVLKAGPWHGRYLAICLSPPPWPTGDEVKEQRSTAGATDEDAPPPAPERTEGEIAGNAARLKRENPFADIECLAKALRNATPREPLFVERVSDDGTGEVLDAYYIVPYTQEVRAPGKKGERQTVVPFVAIFNASSGELEEAVGMPEGTTYQADWFDPEAVLARSRTARVDQRPNNRAGSRFPFRLVWRPSLDTPTRFWPMLEGDRPLDNGQTEPVLTRIDGEELAELEPMRG
jgi:hypothetical protein